jgi:Holliday junction DNA helicase RuvA
VEREFFARFIEVPDVGATRALKALVFSVSTIACWIEEGDIASLRRLPGIGARTAETIVARLRGKVTPFALLRDEGFAEMPEAAAGLTSEQVRRDAVAGMVGLGFSQREASTLVEEITREQALASVEEVIRAVFQRMQKG